MSINRRNFIKLLGGATLLTVVPRRVLGGPNHVAPSDQLTKGIIGVGGIGKSKYHFTSDERCRLVAVCDDDISVRPSNWDTRNSTRRSKPTKTTAT